MVLDRCGKEGNLGREDSDGHRGDGGVLNCLRGEPVRQLGIHRHASEQPGSTMESQVPTEQNLGGRRAVLLQARLQWLPVILQQERQRLRVL